MKFMDIFKNFNKSNKLSWIQVIIMGLIPLGQLWARIFYFNGSLDKIWLMFPLLLFPPLSFIPLILMKYGFISNGKGTNPIDKIMLLPIISKFVIPFILPFIIDDTENKILFGVVAFILQLLIIMIANLQRRYNDCKTITTNSVGKASIDSIIAFSVGDILPVIMGFIPFIGFAYNIVEMIPLIGNFVDNIFWGLGFAASYIIINMVNQENISEFCKTPFTGNAQDKIPFFISLITLLGINIYNNIL